MSVTFSPTADPTVEHSITCHCGTFSIHKNYDTAYNTLQNNKPHCPEPYCYVDITPTNPEPEITLSNINADELFYVLGITGETFSDRCCGTMNPNDFLGRILIAQAVAPISAKKPTYTDSNIIHGGRPEGYVQEKLQHLHHIATYAIKHNRQICWG